MSQKQKVEATAVLGFVENVLDGGLGFIKPETDPSVKVRKTRKEKSHSPVKNEKNEKKRGGKVFRVSPEKSNSPLKQRRSRK